MNNCLAILSRTLGLNLASSSIFVLKIATSSVNILNLPQTRQNECSSLFTSSANAMCKTGSASSMCPKWPGHLKAVLPQVAHFCPGSSVPNRLSIKPP